MKDNFCAENEYLINYNKFIFRHWPGQLINPYSSSLRQFIDISILFNVVLIIICPIIILTTLNVLLLCALRQRTTSLLFGGNAGSDELNNNASFKLVYVFINNIEP